MELTTVRMENAHFANQLRHDPNLPRGKSRPRAWAREMGVDVEQVVEDYENGLTVLERYRIRYSRRFVRGTAQPDIPAKATASIAVDSGHIATSEALRLAYFIPR